MLPEKLSIQDSGYRIDAAGGDNSPTLESAIDQRNDQAGG